MKIRFNFFSKTFLFFFGIIFFLIIASVISTQIYVTILEKRLEERTLRSLTILRTQVDELLFNTYKKSCNYIWSDYLDKLRNSNEIKKDFITGYNKLGRQTDSYIHSIYYIISEENIVVGKNGLSDIDNFFKVNYPVIKRNEITVLPLDKFVELPLLTSFNENSLLHVNVIPYLLPDAKKKGNYLLVNINEDKIFHLLKTFTLKSKSYLIIMDNEGKVRSNTNRVHIYRPLLYPAINDKKFIEKVKLRKSFYSNYFGSKRIIFQCESQKSTINKLYYIFAIPYKELFKQSIPLSIIALIFSFTSFIFFIFLSFILSKNLYSPVKSIINLFNTPEDNSIKAKNEFNYISQNIKKLFLDKKELSEELSKTLPLVTENYLFKILNGNDFLIEKEVTNLLNKNNINFKHKNFIVAVTLINFNNEFYEKFNREQTMDIFNKIYKLFKNTFYDPYTIYILKITKNEFCIIINHPDEKKNDEIVKLINNIHNVFNYYKNYLDIYTGLGKIHDGIIGLRKSYNEAIKAIYSISPFNNKSIIEYDETLKSEKQYTYTIIEENLLLNSLLINNKDAFSCYNQIIQKNLDNGISMTILKNLYLQIYQTGIRVLNRFEISCENLLGNDYIDINHEYSQMNVEAINNYIKLLFKKIINLSGSINNNKIKIASIINYINKHYFKDIYLEGIASEFNISAAYLSRLLKKALGLPFQNYINNLRLKKAKQLLKETNKKIEDIYHECGYNSRFAFIKIFKKYEGLTPKQYRDIMNDVLIKNMI